MFRITFLTSLLICSIYFFGPIHGSDLTSKNVEALKETAAKLCNEGEFSESLRYWNELLCREPRNGNYYLGRSTVHSKMNKVEEAAADYKVAVSFGAAVASQSSAADALLDSLKKPE